WPSALGVHSWQPMSFSPKTNLVYIPTMQTGVVYSRTPKPGMIVVAGVGFDWAKKTEPADGKGALLAWDPIRQKLRWKVQYDALWNGGTLATAGDLVFHGAGDGSLSAYSASTGRGLWRFNAGLGITATPMSYSAGGKQYVSVLVGYGGSTAA